MGSHNRARSLGIVFSALVVGGVFGLLITHRHQKEFAFLEGVRTIAVHDGSVKTSSGTINGTTTYFTFQGDWEQVFARARAEMPNAIVRDTFVGSTPARVLTIPRVENGRTRIFFPPVREITILPNKLVMTESGQLLSRSEPNWASVKVSEYRQPHLLDSAVDWVRDRLHI